MRAPLDLTGQRFGRLLVLRLDPQPHRRSDGASLRRWICRCDCGRETSVLVNNLTSGMQRSCGCLREETARLPRARDLSGQQFGAWTVICREDFPNRRVGWRCRCTCGTERILRTYNLRHGLPADCGCTRRAAKQK